MIFIPKITDSSFDDIKNNLNEYIRLFLEFGVVGFKKINLTIDEQKQITDLIGQELNWHYIPDIHYENHLRSISARSRAIQKDEIVIQWHIEHLERVHSQIATCWNMVHFTCEKGVGNTGFIPSTYLYSQMPVEWRSFLDTLTITHSSLEYPERRAVDFHRNSSKKILRMSPHFHEDIIVSVNNLKPCKEDIELFDEIKRWYCDEISLNKDLPDWWEWDQGDFLIVDLLYMIHSVKGGFTHEERKFARIWAYTEKEHEQMFANKNI